MKVMMVIARLNIGGAAANVIQMVDALNHLPDVEAILVNGKIGEHEGDMQYLADHYHIPQIELASLGREVSPLRDLQTLWQLWRLIRQYKPDVVHTHTAKAGWVGRLAAFLARVPVRVHTFHGHVFSGYFSPRKTQVFLWMERITARISSRVITLSESLRDEIADTYHVTHRENIEVIPLGLDLQTFTSPQRSGEFRKKYGIPPGAPLIAVVGRLVPIKNHRLFLEAALILHTQRPDVHFVIIGDGELRRNIEDDIQRRGLESTVTITGWIENVAAIYGDLDLVTITSDNEGIPVSLIEALAGGIPVVSTDVGGVRDLPLEHAESWLVPSGDAEALAAAWQRTLESSPVLNDIKNRIIERYDLQHIAARHLELYRSLSG